MNKSIILILLGIFAFVTACEKEGDQVIMLDNPKAPQLVTMPDLNMSRDKGGDILVFETTAVDPGFTASAKYALEAAEAGTDFATVIPILSTTQADEIEITVSDLNAILLKHFPEDATSAVDFRVRSTLVVDAGTGAPGTGNDPFEYISDTKTEDVTLFGFLRLDLINSGLDQKIVSPLGDGVYNGFVKLDPANAFTLLDPETSTSYGGTGGVLAIDGAGIVVDEMGWYDLSADINGLTYTTDPYFIGLVGDATPNGWDAPDSKMDYDAATGTWRITIDLIVGKIKFRKNDSWSWNMGFVEGETPGMSGDLQQGGVGNDIPINEAGNYTVIFTILSDEAGTYEIIKN